MLVSVSIVWLWNVGLKHWVVGVQSSTGSVDPHKFYPPWERFNPPVPIKGAALVVHGLNLDPAAMNPLTYFLAGQGFVVFRGALLGHRVSTDEYKDVSRQSWLDEIKELHRLGREADPHVPMICLGFSLGGLLIVDAQSQGMISCDKMILLAPALTTRFPSWLTSILKKIVPELWTLPTANPLKYRRHDRVVMKPNYITHESMDALAAMDPLKLNVPTLLFMSKDDELIDLRSIQDWIAKRNLTNWKVETVSVEGATNERKINHLIIDEASLGEKEWKRIDTLMKDFIGY
jgi:alpha-beta hydrolase superfamily lysophospholipase